MLPPGMENWRQRLPCQAVLDCYERAGLGWTREHAPDGVMYSGDQGVVHLGGCDDWSGAHELAHWLLATPARRAMDDYGGGRGEHSWADGPVVLTGQELNQDEQLAQALTVAILVAIDRLGAHFPRYGTWHFGTLRLDWAELRRRGQLAWNDVPVFMGDHWRIYKTPGPPAPTRAPDSSIPWWAAEDV
jgi:hypothetical protein